MQFEILAGICRGNVASLYLGRMISPEGADIVAVKYRKRSESSAGVQLDELVQNEAVVLVQLSGCKFVPRLHMFRSSTSEIILCTELFTGGDLMSHLETECTFGLDVSRCIVWEIATALDEIHSRSFIHRGLTLESIVLDHSGQVRLVDFGLSHKLGDHRPSDLGSVDYMAPEVLTCPSSTSYASDYWALGIILYEMLYGGPPFSDEPRDRNKTLYRIIHSEVYLNFPRMTDPNYEHAEDLISRLLDPNPTRRISKLMEVRSHVFFKQFSSRPVGHLIRKMAQNFGFMERIQRTRESI